VGARTRILLAAAGLLVAAWAAATPIELASLPPPEPPKPVDQSTDSGTMLDDGSIVMELRT
jgi:hypothetical protein